MEHKPVIIRDYSESDERDLLVCVHEFRKFLTQINPQRKNGLPDEFYKKWMKDRKAEIWDEKGEIFVAEIEGKIVGYVYGLVKDINEPEYIPEKTGNIEELYVMPQYQKEGIATALIEKITQDFKINHCHTITLIVLQDNTHAVDYYHKRNFRTVTQEMIKVI
jgi:ribosomal protein S18 acetylase RimI-like enzyme